MTLDEVAKLAEVSKTTASYVINGKAQKYRISRQTQDKVMSVVKQFNYQPNHTASALRVGNSRSFGLIIPDLENTSYARLAKLLERQSRKAGYQILIGSSDDEPETEQKVAKALISRRLNALFVASCMPKASTFYAKVQESGTPIIALDRSIDDQRFCCIRSENEQGAFELTESLLSSEIKSVGLIGALAELPVSQERAQGFFRACHVYNKSVQVAYGRHFSREEGKKELQTWLKKGMLPDAIVTTSYTLLEGVLDLMLDKPAQFAHIRLATFGDNRLLDFLPFKINSLPQQFELFVDRAMQSALSSRTDFNLLGLELIPRQLIRRSA